MQFVYGRTCHTRFTSCSARMGTGGREDDVHPWEVIRRGGGGSLNSSRIIGKWGEGEGFPRMEEI